MEAQMQSITEDQFYEIYKPIDNHLDKNAGWGGKLYETYGEEKDFCFKLSQKENCVWTIVECSEVEMSDDDDEEFDEEFDEDDEEYDPPCFYIISGFHWVNRVGFMVTEKPYEVDTEVKIDF